MSESVDLRQTGLKLPMLAVILKPKATFVIAASLAPFFVGCLLEIHEILKGEKTWLEYVACQMTVQQTVSIKVNLG